MQVILGVIVKPFGLKGEVKVHSNTSFAKKRYKKGNEVVFKTCDLLLQDLYKGPVEKLDNVPELSR